MLENPLKDNQQETQLYPFKVIRYLKLKYNIGYPQRLHVFHLSHLMYQEIESDDIV